MATSAQLRKQILQGSWDAALAALYGADPAVLQRQRGRYAAALEQFELYFGPGRQVQVYSAPGRAELGGNHTDHQGGYGLAAAVTLDMVAVAARNTDGYVRVKSRGFNKLDVIDLATAGISISSCLFRCEFYYVFSLCKSMLQTEILQKYLVITSVDVVF